MSQYDETPARAVLAATEMMQHLDPGSLAELRRMEKGRAAPAFWRLAARHPANYWAARKGRNMDAHHSHGRHLDAEGRPRWTTAAA